MTGQHEPLWKPEVKSGVPEGEALKMTRIRTTLNTDNIHYLTKFEL